MRRFFEHLEKTDVLLVNPCAGMPLPKIEERVCRATCSRRRKPGASWTRRTPQTKIGIRDKAILEMFYCTGIRLEEMTAADRA